MQSYAADKCEKIILQFPVICNTAHNDIEYIGTSTAKYLTAQVSTCVLCIRTGD